MKYNTTTPCIAEDDARGTTCMSTLYNDVRGFEYLPAQQQVELAVKAQQGDKSAKDELVITNLKMVADMARQYTLSGGTSVASYYPDLFQAGTIGLMTAVDKFDVEKNCAFSTYAHFWIRKEMVAFMKDNTIIRIPKNVCDQKYALKKAKQKLEQAYNRAPTSAELAKELCWSEEEVAKIDLLHTQTYAILSLDAQVGSEEYDNDRTLGAVVSSDERFEDDLIFDLSPNKVAALMNALKENQRAVIALQCGFVDNEPKSMADIKEIMHISRERVRQIKEKGLRAIRDLGDIKASASNSCPEPAYIFNKDNIEIFRTAVLKQAVHDWSLECKDNKKEEIERFLLSSTGQLLSGGNGEYIICKLHSQAKTVA